MAVIMTAELPGADASVLDGLRAAGIPEAMAKARGFVSHVSGVTSSGYRVIEVWQTREDHQAWYDGYIAPTLPPGVGPIPPEYVDLELSIVPV